MGENDSTNPAIPPKVDLKKGPLTRPPEAGADEAAAPAGLAKKQTARIEVPLADLSAPKKKTSRVMMDGSGAPPQGVPVPGAQALPKTIVIKPPASAVPKLAPPIDPMEAAKKMTSRIALETALTAGDGTDASQAASPSTPKTIRIKRPSQASTIKLSRPDAPPEPSTLDSVGGKSKTSRIDVPAESIETEAPTQKKTIKIRRPDATKGVKNLTIARPEGEAATVAATVVAGAVMPDEYAAAPSVGAIFTITALASVFVIGVLLYVLAAQALPGLGLSVPGMLSM